MRNTACAQDTRTSELRAAKSGWTRHAHLRASLAGPSEIPDSDGSDPSMSELRHNRELYGALLAANERVSDASVNLTQSVLLTTAFLIVGLHLEWFSNLLHANLDHFRRWEAYLFLIVAAFFALGIVGDYRERAIYRQHRDEIHELVDSSELSWNEFLAEVGASEELKDLAGHLRKDRGEARDQAA